jgi:hypothetical protein
MPELTPSAEPATAEPTKTPGPGTIGVVVLNQSNRKGLAASVASSLRAGGWQVGAVGNFRGSVPATTVYYPAGAEDAARTLAAQLPGPDRIRPRFGNLSTSRLTIVLTGDYSG